MKALILPTIVSGILFLLLVYLMLRRARGKEKNHVLNSFTIRQPDLAVWVYLALCMYFLYAGVRRIRSDEASPLWAIIMFFAFCLIAAYQACYCATWKVTVRDDRIVFSALFKKTQAFAFADITTIKPRQDGIAIFCGERKVLVLGAKCAGYQTLVDRLAREGMAVGPAGYQK